MSQTTNTTNTSTAESGTWSLSTKVVASVLLSIHLLAVFAAPCASPPPASASWNALAGRVVTESGMQDGWMTPYLRAAYLNHGYRFFAPNPGPSHLVRFEIDLRNGGTIEGRFPDPEESWPRLLYHRMFMISETVFNIDSPVSEPPPLDRMSSAEQKDYYKQRACADALLQGIANQLLQQYNGTRTRLYVVTHEIPFPGDVIEGQSLDDPSLYRERPLGEFSRDSL